MPPRSSGHADVGVLMGPLDGLLRAAREGLLALHAARRPNTFLRYKPYVPAAQGEQDWRYR